MTYRARSWITATLAVALLLVLAAILGALSGPRSADPFFQRTSTFFTDGSGARALLLIMKRLLPSAEQWRRPLYLLPSPADGEAASTLIVAGPLSPIAKAEAEHLDRWLSRGGQLILATSDGWPVGRRLAVEAERESEQAAAEDAAEQAQTNTAKRETYLSRHVPGLQWSKPGKVTTGRIAGSSVSLGEMDGQWRQHFTSIGNAKPALAAGADVLAVEIPVGRGRVVALADPTMVSNGALREADHAVWLVTLAAGWRNGAVLVDEFHHGFGTTRGVSSLTWAFLETPWGWSVAQLAAAGLLYVFGYRRRFGRISEPPPPARASPTDLIDARGGLFHAAAAQGLAVKLMCDYLCQEIGKASGNPVDLPAVKRRLQASGKGGGSARLLTRLEDLSAKTARGEKLTDREFVEVGRVAGQILQGSPP